MTKKYYITLHIEQTIYANDEEEALAIFHDDTLRAWSEEELADVREVAQENSTE